MNEEKIISKIEKLLALAGNNPYENEAKAAALKAQELMAKYHIDMERFESKTETKEIAEEIYLDNGKHTMKKWKIGLAQIVSKNFRCKMYLLNSKDVVFYGYKEDAKIALQVFSFLFEVGNKFAVRLYNEYKKAGRETKGVMNTYLQGFLAGISDVLEKQCTALMIVTPQEITDSFEQMTNNWKTKKSSLRVAADAAAYSRGRQDGKDTMNSRSLNG